jgi:hypothetical protein
VPRFRFIFIAFALAALTVGGQPAAADTSVTQETPTALAEIDSKVASDRVTATEAVDPASVITNGVVSLGVNPHAQLIVPANVAQGLVGVLLNATGFDGIRSGCQCEGWGAAYASPPTTTGWADNAFGPPVNMVVDKFHASQKDAESRVIIGGVLQVTHFYKPSAHSEFLYQADVTMRNVGPNDVTDLRYTRVIDWDVEPTPFADVVTLRGNPSRPNPLFRSTNNGFENPNPLQAVRFPLGPFLNVDFTDVGPFDHGALFDFRFMGPTLTEDGVLRPGESKKITIFYGAAPTEAAALAGLAAEGVEVWTLGQTATGGATGTPNTFIFGFEDDTGREGDNSAPDDPVEKG